MKSPKDNAQVIERIREIAPYIGRTPLYPINKVWPNKKVKIFAKLEWQQFGGSVKARPAYNIVRQAVESGSILDGKTLIDATSGNTGIAYSIFSAVAGIPVTLCIPSNASKERLHILRTLGVNLELTSPYDSTEGAQDRAKELHQAFPDKYIYTDQYSNELNWKAHYKSTAPEIWDQTGGIITHFVAGLGTTGTFTGTVKGLKEFNPDIKAIALQPESALHGLEGWKHLETARVPAIFDETLVDQFNTVDTEASYELLKDVARYEGLILSPSSAANLLGAIKLAEQLDEGIIVTVFPDNGDKYSEVISKILS